jgi:hypothetical protein
MTEASDVEVFETTILPRLVVMDCKDWSKLLLLVCAVLKAELSDLESLDAVWFIVSKDVLI